MKSISTAVIETGIISPNTLAEMRRFAPQLNPHVPPEEIVPLEEAAASIAHVIQGEGQVEFRETELDIVATYLKTQVQGVLHMEVWDQTAEFAVSYGRTRLQEYIFAWTSPSIAGAMTNGQTYLNTIDGEQVFFDDVREVFLDDHKAFMVCRPVAA